MCTSKKKGGGLNRAAIVVVRQDALRSGLVAFQRGISLVELIMTIVIVSVAMAGVMLPLNANSIFSADPLIHKQALTIAESLLEEIELKNFAITANAAGRQNFNDIFDYNSLSASAVTYANSSVPVTGLEGYSVSAVVATLPAAWGGIPAASAALIAITVAGPGGQTVEMTGYKVEH